MRYNPATESQARDLDAIAAECRVAITKPDGVPLHRPLWSANEDFYGAATKTWALCLQIAILDDDRSAINRLWSYMGRDMHQALHHRPHQPEF